MPISSHCRTSKTCLSLLLCLTVIAACQPAATTPSIPQPSATPGPTVTPRPRQQVSFTEAYLSTVGTSWSTDKSPWVLEVRANVQSDLEVYWYIDGWRYGGDTYIDWHMVKPGRAVLEDGCLRFEVGEMHWIGFSLRLSTADEALLAAVYDVQDAVSEELNRQLSEGGYVPVALYANDEALTLTVESR
jgi:hypothetical protein